jgi:polyisoprenoid-binding protein YceI
MHGSRVTVGRTLAMPLLLLLGTAPAVLAQTWAVSQGRVGVVCPLTVGGRFEAKTTSVTGKVALTEGSRDVTGAFVVDLRTLDTGIGLRDAHLRDNYLEVSRGPGYDTAVLDAIVLEAPAPVAGQSVTLRFRGVLTLHGQGAPVAGIAEVSHKKDRLEVKVSFPMRIDLHAIARPTYLGVGVMNQIEVTVRATLKATAAMSSP